MRMCSPKKGTIWAEGYEIHLHAMHDEYVDFTKLQTVNKHSNRSSTKADHSTRVLCVNHAILEFINNF